MKNILNSLFKYLASMNLAIFLLTAISLLIIIQLASEKLIDSFKQLNWLKTIASTDLYHSQWFNVLLILFCINLLACSIKRLPKTIKLLKYSSRELKENEIDSLPLFERIKVEESIESSEKLSSLITNHFKKTIFVKKESGQINLYAEKGRYTHLGFYLAHVSILLIVLGVMLSASGYEYNFKMTKDQLLDPLVVQDSKGVKKTLDFSLLCEDIKTIYYQGTSKVKGHQSTLKNLNDGEKVKTQVLDFSHPLKYGGIEIYQGHNVRKIKYAKIKVVSKDDETNFFQVKNGERFSLKDTDIIITAWKIKSRANTLQLRSSLSPSRLLVSNTPVSFSDKRLKDYQFSLLEVIQKEAISLKVIKDPGKELIWYATFCMLIGFGIVFFIPHQRLWLRFNQEEGGNTIALAGSTTKNQGAFEEKFKDIAKSMKETFPK